MAYEYGKRGACLALVARRENRLKEVASQASLLGSPDVITITADVSIVQDCQISVMPIRSVTEAAKAIVNSACRGDCYLTEPAWMRTTFYWKVFCPEVLELSNLRLFREGCN